ncbi:DUF998 domain-containing protein [Roseibium sediminicola]|uniref:DUF998 domain-containing protein n=1 Tax=Roseibium sediminicola TaxID=2933272 RepID=A0ABT0GZ56_9HYPH|nr:DUF998 domain-containing protein [Roseibium sp. CAU 1639]MCK7614720.1 DUF998 domain-containing protein [Roseibium sp. CAU 1639]
MIKPNPLVLLPVVSFLWLACGVLIAGHFYPGYSHLSQFMSELGASGTARGALVNVFVFAGAEIWVLLFLGLAARKVTRNRLALAGLILMLVYAGLLMTAAFFPCDFECRPVDPTRSHLIHVSAGMAAYAAGLCGLFLISAGLNRAGKHSLPRGLEVAGLLTGTGLLAGMLVSEGHAGLFQRLLEALLYLWMIRIGLVLSQANPQRSSLRAA